MPPIVSSHAHAPRLPADWATRPAVARIVDYLTGGTDNYAADRALAGQLEEEAPWLRGSLLLNRLHATRAVKHLADLGFDQYLDLGCGMPYANQHPDALHTHDAARAVLPDAKVRTVYVDADGPVYGHAQMVLAEEKGTIAVLADATRIDRLLAMPQVRSHLDLERPVAVVANNLLPWVDDDAAHDLMTGLHTHLPDGSALCLTHAGLDLARETMTALSAVYQRGGIAFHPRTRGHLRSLLGPWRLTLPGIVPTEVWGTAHPRYGQMPPAGDWATYTYTAIAVKGESRCPLT